MRRTTVNWKGLSGSRGPSQAILALTSPPKPSPLPLAQDPISVPCWALLSLA